MPLYTYYCVNCDDNVEILCKISERDEQYCLQCESKLERAIDRPGMVWSPTRNGGYST